MKKIILFALLIVVIATGCSTQYKCYPSKKSRDYAGIQVETTLVSVTNTMRGWKNIFVTSAGDSITRYGYERLTVGKCYLVKI